jgi:hypothetical protein
MLKRNLTAVGAVAIGLALAASPAVAKGGSGGGGGGGGGTQPAPAPDPAPVPWALCPEYATGSVILADGSSLFANEIPGVACLVAKAPLTGGVFLYDLRVAPGWVASIKSSGGTGTKGIDVELTNPTTKEKHEISVAPGKTVIR